MASIGVIGLRYYQSVFQMLITRGFIILYIYVQF